MSCDCPECQIRRQDALAQSKALDEQIRLIAGEDLGAGAVYIGKDGKVYQSPDQKSHA